MSVYLSRYDTARGIPQCTAVCKNKVLPWSSYVAVRVCITVAIMFAHVSTTWRLSATLKSIFHLNYTICMVAPTFLNSLLSVQHSNMKLFWGLLSTESNTKRYTSAPETEVKILPFWAHPNQFYLVWTCPNQSKRIGTPPNRSNQISMN